MTTHTGIAWRESVRGSPRGYFAEDASGKHRGSVCRLSSGWTATAHAPCPGGVKIRDAHDLPSKQAAMHFVETHQES